MKTHRKSIRSSIIAIMSILVALFAQALLPPVAHAEFKKTKIAVLDFQIQGRGSDNPDLGKIVAEWFITALVQEGRFDVIERRLLEKVIEEQKIGVSGIVDEGSASKLGKVLGAKIVITGTVLEFQNVLEVNARILEVESSSIIAAENVKSTSGAARLEDLVVEMAQKIIKDFPLEGYVAQRTGQNVLIDLGQRAGIRRGMRFVAYKEGRVIKHPKTGEVLDIESIEIGEIEITDVRVKTSSGLVVKETAPGAVDSGMLVRSASRDQVIHVEEEATREPAKKERQRDEQREEQKKPRSERKVSIPPPMF
jgi:TolB-like protein